MVPQFFQPHFSSFAFVRRPVADEVLSGISLIVSHVFFFLPDAALQRFQSQGISGPDIPLVRCDMQLEVSLSLVLGSSNCQSWGDANFSNRLSSTRSFSP